MKDFVAVILYGTISAAMMQIFIVRMPLDTYMIVNLVHIQMGVGIALALEGVKREGMSWLVGILMFVVFCWSALYGTLIITIPFVFIYQFIILKGGK